MCSFCARRLARVRSPRHKSICRAHSTRQRPPPVWGDSFDPFANETNFLIGAFIFEDVGVTAYKGGSPFIRNRTFLEAAAGLLSVEAYHAGLVRTVLEARGDDIFTGSTTVRDVVDAISGARDSVDGDENIDQGIGENTAVMIYDT